MKIEIDFNDSRVTFSEIPEGMSLLSCGLALAKAAEIIIETNTPNENKSKKEDLPSKGLPE